MIQPNTFDVAISFAGSDRDYARSIQEILTENGVNVFFDELYEAELWGKNLVEELGDIYESKARFCLIIVSQEYVKRVYTNVERRAALERAINSDTSYILPVVTDEAWIKGLPKSTVYLDLRGKSVIGIAEAVIKKLRGKNAPEKILIPTGINVARLPIGSLSANELQKYLLQLCAHSQNAGVVVFGALIYDERTAELRQLLRNEDYWDALDRISGPDFEIFAIRDEQQSRYEGSGMYEMLTAASVNRSHGRTIYFSRLLKEYFDEDDTRLAYPSLLLFLVYSGKVSKCRLVPLSYGTIDSVFDQLRALFSVISDTIAAWRDSDGTSVDILWTSLKKSLLEKDYTLYIQNAPSTAGDAVERLAPFMT